MPRNPSSPTPPLAASHPPSRLAGRTEGSGGAGATRRPAARPSPAAAETATAGALTITRGQEGKRTVLFLSGILDVNTFLELRDAAFTVVGERPPEMCIDVSSLIDPLDSPAVETLMTISRVGKMVGVKCIVRAGGEVAALFEATGVSRLLSVELAAPPLSSTLDGNDGRETP